MHTWMGSTRDGEWLQQYMFIDWLKVHHMIKNKYTIVQKGTSKQ